MIDELRLTCRTPFAGAALLGFLAARAVPGIEEVTGTTYRRTLRLAGGPGVAGLTLDGTVPVRTALALADPADREEAVERCRRLVDAGADPAVVDAALAADPALAPLVRATPGMRVPGTADGFELAVRAVVGQQVSVAGARTVAGRLVTALGEPLPAPDGGLTHVFPAAAALAAAPDAVLPMPAARRRALRALAAADLDLSPAADRDAARRALLALPGIGPWTASYVAMRALGDRDAFLPSDLGVLRGAARAGLPATPAELEAASAAWSPWRAYAVLHLWSA